MIGQKQFSLRDKQAGRKPEDVRVAESPKAVKARLGMMQGGKVQKKKKSGSARRAGSKISKVKNEVKNEK